MFIKYTPYDGQNVGDIDSEMIAVDDISRIAPSTRGGTAWIYTKSGKAIQAATSPHTLQDRVTLARFNPLADLPRQICDLSSNLWAVMFNLDFAAITATQFDELRNTVAKIHNTAADAGGSAMRIRI